MPLESTQYVFCATACLLSLMPEMPAADMAACFADYLDLQERGGPPISCVHTYAKASKLCVCACFGYLRGLQTVLLRPVQNSARGEACWSLACFSGSALQTVAERESS